MKTATALVSLNEVDLNKSYPLSEEAQLALNEVKKTLKNAARLKLKHQYLIAKEKAIRIVLSNILNQRSIKLFVERKDLNAISYCMLHEVAKSGDLCNLKGPFELKRLKNFKGNIPNKVLGDIPTDLNLKEARVFSLIKDPDPYIMFPVGRMNGRKYWAAVWQWE